MIAVFIADLSTISNLNAKLISSTLEREQRTFREPQFAYVSVTFLFTSNTHFQVRHMHFYGTFAFSKVFLRRLTIRSFRLMLVLQTPFRTSLLLSFDDSRSLSTSISFVCFADHLLQDEEDANRKCTYFTVIYHARPLTGHGMCRNLCTAKIVCVLRGL